MNILLVSECSKNALVESRRILDQFAERKGERTWQTVITLEGLNTLRKLLRQSARRNSAVACHWLKGSNQSELLWIVGNQSRFNEQGSVPTNTSGRDVVRSKDENSWHTIEVIALLAGVAGLFHDFGKCNRLFQDKLKPGSERRTEPYRHEWVSLRLFQAFVDGREDFLWMSELANISPDREASLLLALQRYQDKTGQMGANPFVNLPVLAQVIGWLIVSHHRLPEFPYNKARVLDASVATPSLEKLNLLSTSRLACSWNSPQCLDEGWDAADWQHVWDLSAGTPISSATWCAKAKEIAGRALKHQALWKTNTDWMSDRFSCHLARLVLMLADHSYSAGASVNRWQDPTYQAYANTERGSGRLKQKLDEHNIGVGQNALLLGRRLPQLKRSLPAITRHKGFKQRSQSDAFRWQDKAYDLACVLAKPSKKNGFFGVNMASTGCGKTFANARIMYGLSDEKQGCRFSVALGLRTLTLQTGDAMKSKLNLNDDDLAVLIGSQSVQQLHNLRREDEQKTQQTAPGSESADDLFDLLQHVRYEGSLEDGPLRHWLKQSDKLHKLISAPVLVSTIDHLIPATEGTRGGRQIAPMLRLLTSDLVLDEPDDFDLDDLPALCRLVNWAGMLGSRVLLSSATLPPALVCALFEAYQTGWQHFDRACGDSPGSNEIRCAWFDEFGVKEKACVVRVDFKSAHTEFVDKRIAYLNKAKGQQLRRAELLLVSSESTRPIDVVVGMATAIHQGINRLHLAHHQRHETTKCVSFGLVRMANINPLVAVCQQLFRISPPENTRVHFCVYHSQHPMLTRSNMEARLDKALTRHDPQSLWQLPEVQDALQQPEQHHIFLVFASAVAEVGRDHDYDWAIAEPSSMRSLIQLAGRIQRHRKEIPGSPNLLILNKNFRALSNSGKSAAYRRPGFESDKSYRSCTSNQEIVPFRLVDHDLATSLLPEQFTFINANPRIRSPENQKATENLVALEHSHLALRLFGSQKVVVNDYAAQWWQLNAHWSSEMQRRSRFRESGADESYVFYQESETDKPLLHRQSDRSELSKVDQSLFVHQAFEPVERIEPWINNDVSHLIYVLADRLERDVSWVSQRYTELRLKSYGNDVIQPWHFDPAFGVFRGITN